MISLFHQTYWSIDLPFQSDLCLADSALILRHLSSLNFPIFIQAFHSYFLDYFRQL
jgi:hypothetical protein